MFTKLKMYYRLIGISYSCIFDVEVNGVSGAKKAAQHSQEQKCRWECAPEFCTSFSSRSTVRLACKHAYLIRRRFKMFKCLLTYCGGAVITFS